MTWNHRVMFHRQSRRFGGNYFQIHEVYYNDDGKIWGWSKKAKEPYGETVALLREELEMMLRATRGHVLFYDMKPEVKLSAQVPKWPKGAVCKTAVRRFKSGPGLSKTNRPAQI